MRRKSCCKGSTPICCDWNATSTPARSTSRSSTRFSAALHTVKGSARHARFQRRCKQVAHKLENLFDLLRKERMPLSEGCINLLFEGRDILTDLVHAAVDSGVRPRRRRRNSSSGSTALPWCTSRRPWPSKASAPDANAEQLEALAQVDMAEVEAFEAEVARLLAREHVRPRPRHARAGVPQPVAPQLCPALPAARAGGSNRRLRPPQTGGNCRAGLGCGNRSEEPDDPGRHRAARHAAQSRRRTRDQPHAHLGHRRDAGPQHRREQR